MLREALRALGAGGFSLVLAGAGLLSAHVPLALAPVCVLPFGPAAVCAYLGAVAGYAVFWGLSAALEPVAAGFLMLAGSCLFRDLLPAQRRGFVPAAAGGIYALLGLIFVLQADGGIRAALLVDTYNTLKSGIPNAIRVFNEVLKPRGLTKCGIRLDSGDMTYLTKKARKLLDEAGWQSCRISCSNSLDEYIIEDILNQGAQIDLFGVGERLITAKSEAVFGGVYKLTAIEDENGTIIPKIKISENVGKITNPHFKKVYRFFGNDTGKAIADYLCVHDETVDDSSDLEIFDPQATWKRKRVYNFTAKELLVPIFKNGELVYKLPKLDDIQKYCAEQVDTLWDEVKRFDNPHTYYVDLSQKLWDIKDRLLHEGGRLDR